MESRSLVAPAGTSGEDINGITPRRHEDHEVKNWCLGGEEPCDWF
jgi:hypothetical protein